MFSDGIEKWSDHAVRNRHMLKQDIPIQQQQQQQQQQHLTTTTTTTTQQQQQQQQ